jgi:hypothetical protein
MLNKYKELHEKHIDALARYYNIHLEYVRKPTYERSIEIRAVLSELRTLQTQMRDAVQEYKKFMSANRRQNREGNADEHN